MIFNDFTGAIFVSYCLINVVNKPLQNIVAYDKQHLNLIIPGLWIGLGGCPPSWTEKWLDRAAGFEIRSESAPWSLHSRSPFILDLDTVIKGVPLGSSETHIEVLGSSGGRLTVKSKE